MPELTNNENFGLEGKFWKIEVDTVLLRCVPFCSNWVICVFPGHEDKQECNVLVLYVGGTIGMVRNADGSKQIYIII